MKQILTLTFLLLFGITMHAQVEIDCDGALSVEVGGSSSGDPLDVTGVTTDNMCDPASGDVTGSVDITVTGGTAPYTYIWTQDGTPYATTEDLDDLVAGEYCVTVTDAVGAADPEVEGCTFEICFTITQPPPVTISLVPTDPICAGASGDLTGEIDLTAGGGVPGYTYTWSYDGSGPDNLTAGAEDQTGLAGGWYYATVTDSQGCEANDSIQLSEPDAVSVTGVETDPDCNVASGDLTGAIDITPADGVTPYTYAWTGPGVSAAAEDQTGLGTGTYNVTVTDANDCTATAEFELTEPTPVEVTALETDLGCNSGSGAADGAIDITASGGTAPYTYAWTTGDGSGLAATDEDQTGLSAGTYTVVVTDANDCTATADYTLDEPSAVEVAGVETDLSCNAASGAADGAIDITASGGTAPYTYAWTTGDGSGLAATDEDQTGLSAGTYTVVVTDANNCTTTADYTLDEPTPVDVTGVETDLGCNSVSGAADGAIDITASGGTAPYTYAWTTGDGSGLAATDEDQTGLSAGTYTVVVTDANNCTTTADYTLDEPTPVDVTGVETDLGCNAASGAADGAIDITATGGTAPYTYAWTTGDGSGLAAADEDQTGLSAGTYTVVVTDANDCTATADFTLDEPTPVDVTGVETDLGCNAGSGAADGAIDITASGGTAPYTYAWTTGDGSGLNATDEDQTGLSAGTYTVVVTDANDCTATADFTLDEPTAVEVTGVETDLSCNSASGAADGAIDITASGGTAPYTYAWTTGDGSGLAATDEDQTGLSAGTYTVVVTDANNCTTTADYTLDEPTAVEVTGVETDLGCNSASGAADGAIDITATGGTAPYTYAWTTGDGSGLAATDEDQTGLSAGTYTVVVTDANNCTTTADYTLDEPTPVDVTGVETDLGCNASSGAADGAIDITATGGTAPYTYTWTTGDGSGLAATDEDQTGLSAGTYTVVVTDANDCTATADFTLDEPTPVDVTGVETDLGCNAGSGAADGAIDITASGGTAPYTYAWTTGDGSGLAATDEDQTGLSAGTYTVVVTDANDCTATADFTLDEPTAVEVTGVETDLSCNAASGAADGAIDITASGGTAPYTYAWTTGDGSGLAATDEDQTGLSAGTYTVVVTDANNCTTTADYTLDEPTAVEVTAVETDLGCNSVSGAADGAIDITATGGTAPYTYAWTTGDGSGLAATDEDQTGLSAGTYTVVVTDANNCTTTADYTLDEPTPVEVTGVETDLGCNALSGAADGAIDITPTGGTAPYTFVWTTGDGSGLSANDEDQTGLSAGTYTVVVSDANSCTATETFDLTEPTPLTVDPLPVDLLCNTTHVSPPTGSIDLQTSGGTAPYTYVWGGDGAGESTETITQIAGGTYTVTVTDDNGCSTTAEIDIFEPTVIQIIGVVEDPNCNDISGAPDGTITINVTGGTGSDGNEGDENSDYTYAWAADPGNSYADNLDPTSDNQTGLSAGTYFVTVTDENGCQNTADYTLEEPTPITVTGVVVQPGCNVSSGAADGSITITPGGGIDSGGSTPTYTYAWTASNGGALVDDPTSQNQTQLGEGTYIVIVSDGNCTATDTFDLTEPEAVSCTLDNDPEGGCNDILCAGGVDTIFVIPDGGTAPYTYSLDGAAAQTDSFFIVTAGTYTVTTIDANDCENTCEITLDEPNPLAGGTCTVDDDCQIGEGTIEVAATGGCAPYTVSWVSPTGGDLNEQDLIINSEGGSVIFTGAEGGETYNFTIVDANGCQIP